MVKVLKVNKKLFCKSRLDEKIIKRLSLQQVEFIIRDQLVF